VNAAAVRIDAGYYLIDTDAWIAQRVGARDDEHTRLLREFTGHDLFRRQLIRMDVASRVVLWCAARDWLTHEGAPLVHDHPQLTEPVSIVLATTPQPDRQPVAIIAIDDADPVVYADVTSDDGYWHQVTTVEVVCPGGHRLTWDGGRRLIDHDGEDTAITQVFGTGLYAPFQPCRVCASDDDGTRAGVDCDCGGWAIYCPVCDARTTLRLPDVPTHDRPTTPLRVVHNGGHAGTPHDR
jgi:hypothetical protein